MVHKLKDCNCLLFSCHFQTNFIQKEYNCFEEVVIELEWFRLAAMNKLGCFFLSVDVEHLISGWSIEVQILSVMKKSNHRQSHYGHLAEFTT